MNREQLIRRLRRDKPTGFVERLLFDDNAWFFPTRSGSEYDQFKENFAKVFQVAPSDLAVVGSAKYGFSLSPDKQFRQFQSDESLPEPSDIDLIVVSRSLFNGTWNHLRRADYKGAVNARHYFQEDVFRRFIMVGADDERDSFYLRDLSQLIDRVRKVATTRMGITQTIKLRVYATWTDAKAYHIWSMQKLAEHHGL